MEGILAIAGFLTVREQGRLAGVGQRVLNDLGGLNALCLDRLQFEATIQIDIDVSLDMDETERLEQRRIASRFAHWFFHEDRCSCPLCED